MPCRCDYLEPNAREQESGIVAQHLVYLYTKLGKPIPIDITKAAKSLYGDVKTVDANTDNLCSTIRALSEEQLNEFVYNGRIRDARRLADWWETHQQMDKEAGR